jgi:peptide chain release factor 2
MYALTSPGRKCDPDTAAKHSGVENAGGLPYHRTSLAAIRGRPSLSPVFSMYIPPEIRANLDEIERRAGYLWKFLDVPGKQAAIAKLEEQMGAQNFWDSQKAAQKVISECNGHKNTESPDGTADAEVEELRKLATDLLAAVSDLEIASFLSGLHDRSNAIVTVKAGAGGTESNDWADLLYRMYTRWAERRGFKIEVEDIAEGEGAGISQATFRLEGPNAYGYVKAERGVHRLVRISPFDANARRHTSFASVDVVAEIDDDIDVEVNEADLRVDVYRSSGKGGQHVNKTESAVRLTHIPTGIVVACQRERSQVKNRALAMKILRARIYEKTIDDKRAEMEKYYGEKGDIGWGNQIRSYVFQPYQMVKDLRTGVETGNIQAVMDGDIDAFINGWLRAGGPRTRNKDIKIED